jgi:predicted TIM-barrel fold metal-dependent hydrolase
MGYDIISGDSHVDLRFMPAETFLDNARPEMKDKMPRVVETPKGRRWTATGTDLGIAGHDIDLSTFSTSMGGRHKAMMDGGFFGDTDIGFHPTNAQLRIKDQDKDGVEAEVLYGLLRVGKLLKDNDQVTEIFRIYNDWAAAFCKANPSRFAGLACIPNHTPQAAADELRRAADIGLKGADFGVGATGKPIYHRDWDVLWQAAHDTGLPISFHTTGLIPMQPTQEDATEYDGVFHNIRTVLFQLSGAEFLTSTVLSGACERFPNFKFVLGECGVSWIPYVIDRMDHECEGAQGLKLKPSEYWTRQGYSTFQKELVAGDLIPMVGVDNVIWGSDYPHQDGVWPDSLQTIEDCLHTLDPQTKRKVICETTAKLYGFQL